MSPIEEDVANHPGLQRRGDWGSNVVLIVRVEGRVGQPTQSVPGYEITSAPPVGWTHLIHAASHCSATRRKTRLTLRASPY